jgi:hypothetical protein
MRKYAAGRCTICEWTRPSSLGYVPGTRGKRQARWPERKKMMSAPFPEEEFARELHAKLLAAGFASRLSGVGVHWHCSVGDENHHSRTNCFGAQGAEYLSEFVDRTGSSDSHEADRKRA